MFNMFKSKKHSEEKENVETTKATEVKKDSALKVDKEAAVQEATSVAVKAANELGSNSSTQVDDRLVVKKDVSQEIQKDASGKDVQVTVTKVQVTALGPTAEEEAAAAAAEKELWELKTFNEEQRVALQTLQVKYNETKGKLRELYAANNELVNEVNANRVNQDAIEKLRAQIDQMNAVQLNTTKQLEDRNKQIATLRSQIDAIKKERAEYEITVQQTQTTAYQNQKRFVEEYKQKIEGYKAQLLAAQQKNDALAKENDRLKKTNDAEANAIFIKMRESLKKTTIDRDALAVKLRETEQAFDAEINRLKDENEKLVDSLKAQLLHANEQIQTLNVTITTTTTKYDEELEAERIRHAKETHDIAVRIAELEKLLKAANQDKVKLEQRIKYEQQSAADQLEKLRAQFKVQIDNLQQQLVLATEKSEALENQLKTVKTVVRDKLETERAEHVEDVQDRDQRIKELEHALQGVSTHRANLEKRVRELEAAYAAEHEKLTVSITTAENLRGELNNALQTIEQLNAQIANEKIDHEAAITALNEQHVKETHKWEVRLSKSEAILKKAKEERAQLQDRVRALEAEIKRLNTEYRNNVEALKQKLQAARLEIEQLNITISKQAEEHENELSNLQTQYQQQITVLQTRIGELETNVEALETQRSEVVQKLQDTEAQNDLEVIRITNEHRTVIETITKEKKMLQVQIDTLNETIANLKAEHEDALKRAVAEGVRQQDVLRNQINALEDNVRRLTDERDQLKNEIARLQALVEQQAGKIASLEAEKAPLLEKLAELEAQLANVTQKLNDTNAKLAAQAASYEKLSVSMLEQHTIRYADLENTHKDTITTMSARAAEQIDALNGQITALQTQINDMNKAHKAQLIELSRHEEGLESKVEDLKLHSAEVNQTMVAEASNLQNKMKTIESKFSQLATAYKHLAAQLEIEKAEKVKLEQEIARKNEEIKQTQPLVVSIRQEGVQKNNELSEKIKNLTKERDLLVEHLKFQETKNGDLEGQINAIRNELNECKTTIITVQQQKVEVTKKYDAQLAQYAARVPKLESELKARTNELTEALTYKPVADQLKKEKSELIIKLADLRSQMDDLRKIIDANANEIARLGNENDALRRDYEAKILALTQEIGLLQVQIRTLEAKYAELQERANAERNQHVAQLAQQRDRIQELEKEVQRLNGAIVQLEDQNVKAKQAEEAERQKIIAVHTERVKVLDVQLHDATAQNEATQAELTKLRIELEGERDELNACQARVAECEALVAAAKKEKADVERRLREAIAAFEVEKNKITVDHITVVENLRSKNGVEEKHTVVKSN